MHNELKHLLNDALCAPLPGSEAQYRMAHISRPRHMPAPADDVQKAAVLALFFLKQGDWHIVLIRRTERTSDKHSGQISFPGGKQENGESLKMTALRECEEEIACPKELVSISGKLTPLHIPVSNFVVHPFAGVLREQVEFIPQESEVRNILEVPLRRFLEPSTMRNTEIELNSGLIIDNVPCFLIDDHIVWGATAMMMSELLELIRRNGQLADYLEGVSC